MPDWSHLQDECLFCNPAAHGQENQVLLRSDNFYLFAGIGPLVEGYIIIAPYRCDDPIAPYRSFSDIPLELIDEVVYLRNLVSAFYRDVYHQEASMYFEHGRAGSCFPHSSDTKHCYHAHLCCYPRSFPLWEDISSLMIIDVNNLTELKLTVNDRPYLLMESTNINPDVAENSSLRENWVSKVAIIDNEQIPSQYLRQLMAARLGDKFNWDWALFPQLSLVQALTKSFGEWLKNTNKYELRQASDGINELDFLKSVEKSNRIGNNDIANDFHDTWAGNLQHSVVGKFLSRIKENQKVRSRILDIGCGPGNYLKAFYAMGLECVGYDVSDEMVRIARKECGKFTDEKNDVPPPKIEVMSLFDAQPEKDSFDGIWCSAVVVHIPRIFLPKFLSNIHEMLKKDGILYISALIGKGCDVRREGRVFFYYGKDEFEDYLSKAGFEIVEEWENSTDINTRGGKRTKYWQHFLLKPIEQSSEI